VLFCEIPKDGIYLLQVRDSSIAAARILSIGLRWGELPLVTGVFRWAAVGRADPG